MVDVQGTVADGFEPVRDAFVRNFAERGDTGAAVCVHRDGRPVVDLWAGDTGDAHGTPWSEGTAVLVRSAGKGPAAAVLHLLHQRGQLDLDAPVGTYWPEFKARGKERVLVRHLLTHRAGLPAIDTPLSPAEAVDGVSGPRALAAQAPAWEPGTAHGYHAQTYSWLLSELVARATGRGLGRWFDEEVAGPLGLDLRFGISGRAAAAPGRLARLEPVAPPEQGGSGSGSARGLRTRPKKAVAEAYADPRSLTRRAFGAIDPAPDENDPAFLAAGLPGQAGVATARSLSRFYASLTGPLPDARRLFAPATMTQARSEESAGPDRVLVVDTRFGLGFMLHGGASPMLGPGSFGHPGRGGSLAFADPENGVAFGYATRRVQTSVTSDPRPQALIRALRGCL
ncbi:serine hydrolase domain-containing protein [Streptomyces sp. ODS28]|uniref:serine hydrolase domain-containing protein n=1 Tax=Streptomyces sp. ODS28 TaxID=3136688 RepID=UPI0031F0552C